MPGPASPHAAHDPLLVAAHAAGDASGADLARAAALVASCPECARLHRDLRALSSALGSAPAPARPRDFRLDAERAAELSRPAGWRRLLAPLSARRSAAGPLAASLAALGLAGLLLGGGVNIGFSGSTSTAGVLAPQAASSEAPAQAVGSGGGNFDANSGLGDVTSGAAALPSPAASAASAAASAEPVAAASAAASREHVAAAPSAAPAAPSAAPSLGALTATAAPLTPQDKSASAVGSTAANATAAPSGTSEANIAGPGASGTVSGVEPAPEGPSGPSPIMLGSLALLAAGVVLGILRLAARRLV